MCSNRLLTQAWAATILLSFCFAVPASGAKDCADVPVERVIEKIPLTELEGTTCIDPGDDVVNLQSYATVGSKNKCPLSGVSYPAHDVIYKVKLNKGNEVAFLLTPLAENGEEPPPGSTTPDLVLALITACDDGLSCVSSSPDFIGTGKEQIPAAKYDEGVYYLVVDSFYNDKTSCGKYRLKVTGVNPTPDLSLEVKADSKRAVAGEDLVYTLTISNSGDAEAQGVKLTLTLPPGVIHNDKNVVEWDDISIPPRKDETTPGTWTTDLKADVGQHLEGKMITSARAEIKGYPPAQDSLTTTVDHKHDLSVHLSAPPDEAIAGNTRTYTLTLKNDGPSDATDVTVIDTLDKDECFPATDCSFDSTRHQIIFEHLVLEAHTTQSKTFTVLVKSSAISLSNTATIGTLTGSEPNCKKGPNCNNHPNTHRLDTLVERETDLFIGSITASRLDREPNGSIPAGAPFAYAIEVRNAGPSDSSGGIVTIRGLPGYLEYLGPHDICMNFPEEDGSFRVTCTTQEIPAKGRAPVPVQFSLRTSPDLEMTSFHGTAEVAANETDPVDSGLKHFDTDLVIEADLQFETLPAAIASRCGGDILYSMWVVNRGPSDSSDGTVTGVLDGLSFVTSPDGCTVGSDYKTVTCPVGSLTVEDSPVQIQFKASPTKAGTVTNKLSVQGESDTDTDPITLSSTVAGGTDLEVALSISDDPLKPNQAFTYKIEVTNHGLSKTEEVKVEVALPPEVSLPSEPDSACAVCSSLNCTVPIRNIEAGSTGTAMICVLAPSEYTELKATASVAANSCNSDSPENISVDLATAVVPVDEADLSVTMTADLPVVSVGDKLTYTLHVANRGFEPAEGVAVAVNLPAGLEFDSEEGCADCAIGHLALNSERTIVITTNVVSDEGGLLKTTASVSAVSPNDSYTGNDNATVSTPQTAPLVVPFVKVDAHEKHPTTLFRLTNPTASGLSIEYKVFLLGELPPLPPINLSPNATATVNLLDLGVPTGEGHVEITPPLDAVLPSGDFTLVNSAEGTATGERLVSADTDLCERVSVRFLNGQPAGSSTELLFFVPDNPGNVVVATGRVFNESGIFVQDIKVDRDQESFSLSIDVPTSSGSIEWTFAPGLVGSVTAVHKRSAGDEVAIPGFCRKSDPHPGAQSLILPFFQTNSTVNTHVAVHNETDEEVRLEISYSDKAEEMKTATLAPHAVWTANLRNYLPETVATGFLRIEAFSIQDDGIQKELGVNALSGDFIRIGPDGLAGSALIENPAGLCSTWALPFDETPQETSQFLVYGPGQGTVTVDAYTQGGIHLDDVSSPSANSTSFLVIASELNLSGSGSIRWAFGVDDQNVPRKGFVGRLLTVEGPGGKYSILIPGSCR